MRKVLAAAALAALMLEVIPSQAGTTNGTIVAPVPFAGLGFKNPGTGAHDCTPDDATCHKGPVSRGARCAWLASPDTNGTLGYVIPITASGTFTLKASPVGSNDFDVAFYKKLGSCEGAVPRDPRTPKSTDPDTCFGDPDTCPGQYIWGHFGNGTETGTIPSGAKFAIVTLWGGANANFTFTQ